MKHLSPVQIYLIYRIIDKLFDNAKKNILNENSVLSIPGIFKAASWFENNIPDESLLYTIVQNVNNFIDSYKAKTKADLVKVLDFVGTGKEEVISKKIEDVWKKATVDINRLVVTEAQVAKNMGVVDGIVKVNEVRGVEDPTIAFITMRDNKVCLECKRLHLLEDGTTPRVWKLSEVGTGYHKKGENNPKIAGPHCNCRCSLVTILPGQGFGKNGLVVSKELGYDVFEEQRVFSKAEEYRHDGPCFHEAVENDGTEVAKEN